MAPKAEGELNKIYLLDFIQEYIDWGIWSVTNMFHNHELNSTSQVKKS